VAADRYGLPGDPAYLLPMIKTARCAIETVKNQHAQFSECNSLRLTDLIRSGSSNAQGSARKGGRDALFDNRNKPFY
jgi:hypothetical protein